MNKINELKADNENNINQLVRWVNNKEEHTLKVQEIVEQYFMHQRIKPEEKGDTNYDKYITQLTLMHKLSVYAMKCKQTTDVEWVKKMRAALHDFEHSYFSDHKH